MTRTNGERSIYVRIVSGDGVTTTRRPYTGRQTCLALKRALQRERKRGARWAHAEYFRAHAENGATLWDRFDAEVWP